MRKQNLIVYCQCIYFAIAIVFAITVAAEPRPDASNVCNKTVSKLKTISVPSDISYEKDVPTSCGILGCTKRQKVTKPATKYETRSVNMTVLACCDGYAENIDRDCLPICSNACIHGTCHKPEVCACHRTPSENAPGYMGPTCNRFVCKSPDQWGKRCENECSCSSHGFCYAETGDCLCDIGWGGQDCSEPCPSLTDCRPPIDREFLSIKPQEPFLRSAAAEIVAETPAQTDNPSRAFAAHVGINLLVTIIGLGFLYGLLSYRRKFRAVRDELYYVTYTTSSQSASSSSASGQFDNPVYSLNNDSGAAECNNVDLRPALPEPNQQFPGKDESFASATRDEFGKGTAPRSSVPSSTQSEPYIINPKVEHRLMTSKKDAKENLYCESREPSSSYDPDTSQAALALTPPTSSAHLDVTNSNDYQVPKSPVRVPSSIHHHQYQPVSSGEVDEANIYEEIKTESIYRNDS